MSGRIHPRLEHLADILLAVCRRSRLPGRGSRPGAAARRIASETGGMGHAAVAGHVAGLGAGRPLQRRALRERRQSGIGADAGDIAAGRCAGSRSGRRAGGAAAGKREAKRQKPGREKSAIGHQGNCSSSVDFLIPPNVAFLRRIPRLGRKAGVRWKLPRGGFTAGRQACQKRDKSGTGEDF